MDEELIRLIWRRAHHCCEYCQLPQAHSQLLFEIDHIIARKHAGVSTVNNLALTCFYCNRFKGSNIAGRDPRSRRIVPLFNPRRHKWNRHFRWKGSLLVGRTPAGRATIAVLNINDPEARAIRAALISGGLFPPLSIR